MCPPPRLGSSLVAHALWVGAALMLIASPAAAQSSSDSSRAHRGVSGPGAPTPSATSSEPGPITLAGHVVRPGGAPIAHVLVSLFGTTDSAVTRDDGGFVLHAPRPGAYMVGARGLGLRENRFAVSLTEGAPHEMTITMVPFVPMLPRVVTTAEERTSYSNVGFDQRRRSGIGQFLTYDQILRRRPSAFTDLLEGMRGVMTSDASAQSRTPGGTTTTAEGGCVSYVVDGIPQQLLTGSRLTNQGGEIESPNSLIDVSQVGALEVYSAAERPPGLGGMEDRPQPAPEPPEPNQSINPEGGLTKTPMVTTTGTQANAGYMPAQPCGLVVVWTRERLGLTETHADSVVPDARVQKTAPHDVTRGLSAFARGSACSPPAATDTMDLLVYATIQGATPGSMSDSAWSVYRGQVLAALARAADVPSEVVLPAFGAPSARGTPHAIPSVNPHGRVEVIPVLATVLSVTLDTTGALQDVHVAASSLSGGTDTSALAMIEQAAAAHAFPPVTGGQVASDSIEMYLVVEGAEPAAGAQAVVLGQLEIPAWWLSRPARLVSGAPRGEQGRGARNATGGDSITVTMVVDSTGHVAPGTALFEVSERGSASPVFQGQDQILHMLPALRFEPARIGSCPVSTLVSQAFSTSDLAEQQR